MQASAGIWKETGGGLRVSLHVLGPSYTMKKTITEKWNHEFRW